MPKLKNSMKNTTRTSRKTQQSVISKKTKQNLSENCGENVSKIVCTALKCVVRKEMAHLTRFINWGEKCGIIMKGLHLC